MSRPSGSKTDTKYNSIETKASTTFPIARKQIVDVLQSLSFVKVVSVQASPRGIYHGEAIEVQFRNSKEKPKLVFFDKLGRSRNLLKIGPIQLAQAPLGLEHPSSVPTVGDFLVGSLVPNSRKSHLEFVLRGWSSDAKPLYELLRLLKFGTKMSEFEARTLLVQSSANLMQASEDIRKTRDDIYTMARIILWSSLRFLQVKSHLETKLELKEVPSEVELLQATNLRLSLSAAEYIDTIVGKFSDDTVLDKFLEGFQVPEQVFPVKTEEEGPAFTPYVEPTGVQGSYRPTSPYTYAPTSPVYGYATSTPPPYAPTSGEAHEVPKPRNLLDTITSKLQGETLFKLLEKQKEETYDISKEYVDPYNGQGPPSPMYDDINK